VDWKGYDEMQAWLKQYGKYVLLGLVLVAFLVGIPLFLEWVINGLWADFWPHQKTSPEVDAAFVNAIIGFMTVAVTVFATYLINRQTIKETAKMNNETQKLMMKQLEIQEQQARSTLRDYVYQQRVEFYMYLLENMDKCNFDTFDFIDSYKEYGFYDEEKTIELKEYLISYMDTMKKKYPIASKRMQDILYFYIGECDGIKIAISQYLKKEELPETAINHLEYMEDYHFNLEDYQFTIEDIINLELNLQQINQDMDELVDESSKEKLHELTNKTRQMKEEWDQGWNKLREED
jgi:ABC-type multidrug transport system fused ATPase/permease subunit